MRKIQIWFPDPLMRKLREAAEAEDRPVSEEWLLQKLSETSTRPKPPRAKT